MEPVSTSTPPRNHIKRVSFETENYTPTRRETLNTTAVGNRRSLGKSSTRHNTRQNLQRSPYFFSSSEASNFASPGITKAQFEKENQNIVPKVRSSNNRVLSTLATHKKVSSNGLNSFRQPLVAVTTEKINVSQSSQLPSSKTKTTNTPTHRSHTGKIKKQIETRHSPKLPHDSSSVCNDKDVVVSPNRNTATNSILQGEMHILQAEEESLLIEEESLLFSPDTSLQESAVSGLEQPSINKKPGQFFSKSSRYGSTRKNERGRNDPIQHANPPRERDELVTAAPTPKLSHKVTLQDMMDPTATQSRPPTRIDGSQEVRASGTNSSIARNGHVSGTPYHHRGTGVCMDLSVMFSGQKSHRKMTYRTPKRTSPPRQHSNGTVTRSAKRSIVTIVPENDDWANKQCETFSKWLNYTLLPNEDQEDEAVLHFNMHQSHSDRRTSFRTLIFHQQMARVRTDAAGLFMSSGMQSVRTTILSEIKKGKLAIRTDKDMYRNLSHRHQITSLLLSYSTPWLRLGLEAIFGEIILPEFPQQLSPKKKERSSPQKKERSSPQKKERSSPQKKERSSVEADYQSGIKSALKEFIRDRVLSDAVVLAKYTKRGCKMPSGNFEKRYSAELRSLVLYRLMVLIFFIDRAKMANVLEKFPRLFTKHSFVKSTKAVLEALCRDFLEAQGDITKHLSKVGLKVFYKQDAVDEIDLSIRNLAVDLRDGVRLTGMAEVLTRTKRKALMSTLRLPAVSRLQKLHNVGVALQALRKFDVPISNDIAAHHIVDGHREMVLNLMWTVVAYCCLRLLLDDKKIEGEIQNVTKARKKISLFCNEAQISVEPIRFDESGTENDKRRILLLRWCQAVCSRFGLKVVDFTNSFADGRALCLLIHYYHPKLLELEEILPTTNDLSVESPIMEHIVEQRRSNERANSQLANSRMLELGGIPKMLPITDTIHIPEEKSMILCLSYMCSRLIESSAEIRASILIQNQYRKYRALVLREEKELAGLVILLAWRDNRDSYFLWQRNKYGSAVSIIESFFLANRDSMLRLKIARIAKEKQQRAIIIVQSQIRCFLCRHQLAPILAKNRAAIVIQCLYRCYRARWTFQSLLIQENAALDIQRCWRGYQPRLYLKVMVLSTIQIQAVVRSHFVRTGLEWRVSAAICIQRVWRGFLAQLEYQVALLDIIAVQSLARRRIAISIRERSLDAVLVLQLAVRRFLSVCRLLRKRSVHRAAATCQSVVRRFLAVAEKERRRKLYRSASLIQSLWRAYSARILYLIMRLELIRLQSYIRGWLGCLEVARMRKAVACTTLQAQWRMYRAVSFYQRSKANIIVLQALARGYSVRRTIKILSLSSCICQAQIRRFIVMKKIERAKRASIVLQAKWRGHQRHLLYQRNKGSIVFLQACIRGYLVRHQIETYSINACICQAQIRHYLCRKKFKQTKRVLNAVQAMWRGHRVKVSYHCRKVRVIRLQSIIRGFLARCAIRDQHLAAIRIQASWRGFSSFIVFQLYRCDVITVQNVIRQHLAYRELLTRKAAVQRLQTSARQWIARLNMLCAARIIQSFYRGYLIRSEIDDLNSRATVIQRIYRGYMLKLQYEMDLMDIMIVQGVARGMLTRKQLFREQVAAVRLQQSARVWAAKRQLTVLREIQEQLELEEYSAILIQQIGRRYIARCFVGVHRAAVMIQKTWRCYTVHVDFMLAILSAITIQSFLRGRLCKKMYKSTYEAVVLLQAVARGASQRREFETRKHKAISIQSCFRMSVVRNNFFRHRDYCIVIQGLTRGFLARKELALQEFAAVQIQKIWRSYLANVEYVLAIIATIKIQSAFRMKLAMEHRDDLIQELLRKRGEELFRNKVAAKIQRAFRDFIHYREMLRAVLIIQVAARKFLSELAIRRLMLRVTLAQSMVRGYLTRKRRTKRVRIAASRIMQANLRAEMDPRMKLGARTVASLKALRKSTRLVEIMTAVCTLEVATRLSEACCVAVVRANATDILFSLIRTCNRSLPHVELLNAILLTMMNISMYDYLWSELDILNAAEIFLDLVQMFRDKENVFSLSVTFLERCVRFNEDVESMCKSRENMKRLKGVHALCVRKLSCGGGRPSVGQKTHNNARGKLKQDTTRLNCPYDMRYGVKTLKSLIALLENEASIHH